MSDDKELLELAARAAGKDLADYEWFDDGDSCGFWIAAGDASGFWNPLADNGDALRLAVRLRLCIDHNTPMDNDLWVIVSNTYGTTLASEEIGSECQRLGLTRRAILRAAAEIERNKPSGAEVE